MWMKHAQEDRVQVGTQIIIVMLHWVAYLAYAYAHASAEKKYSLLHISAVHMRGEKWISCHKYC